MSDKDYFITGDMYQYKLGWLIKELMSFKQDLATAIDLKTIKYADPIQWDITTQYPANTVVVDPKSGTAYMSKVPVPAGVELNNANYWVVVFNYQNIYNKIMDGVAFNDRDQNYATKDLLVNDLVWYAGELYRATRAIPTGSKYIPGTNLVKTTIESLLARYYGRDRTAQVSNDTVNVSGDYTLIAGDIAETASNVTLHSTRDMLLDSDGKLTEQITGNREIDVDGNDSVHIGGTSTRNVVSDYTLIAGNISETASNVTLHSTRDMLLDSDGKLTEQITGNREIDVDGNDSVHIDGTSTINVGGLRTEVYAGDKTEGVTGTYTGKFGAASFETSAPNWKVKFPNKTVDLADIGTVTVPKRNFWIIGDSYGSTYHPDTKTYTDGWCDLLAKNLLPTFPSANNIYIDYQGGAGFSGGSTTFTAFITERIAKYNDITDVIICAGRNDFFEPTNKINDGMRAVANVIKAKFPNARLYVGMIGYDLNTTEITDNKFYAAIQTTVNYKNGAANYGYTYLTNVEAILHNTDLMRADDGKHPNEAGGNKLAEGIFQALQGCCNVGYPLRSCSISINNGKLQGGDLREILNNTTISILNSSGINMTFSPNRQIYCNPEGHTELLGTVDFKYYNGYEYGLSRIPALFVYSGPGGYASASGYVEFNGHKLYIAILKINDDKNNYDTIDINTLQIMPFSAQYTF